MADIEELKRKLVITKLSDFNNDIDKYIEDCKYKGDKGSLIMLKEVMMQQLTQDQIENIDAHLSMQYLVGEDYRSDKKIQDVEWEKEIDWEDIEKSRHQN